MTDKGKILKLVKNTINMADPNATVILYGSYARGEEDKYSDIDLLVLVDKEKISRVDQKKIKYPVYDIEFDLGIVISTMVLTKKNWETMHVKTPFYENITREGIVL